MAAPEYGSKVRLSCVLRNDVICSFRKDSRLGLMDRCFSCEHYVSFNRDMDEEDAKLDAEFLEESNRVNVCSRCIFEVCLCDGEIGKFACFGLRSVDGVPQMWCCKRFDVEKLEPKSVMRVEYQKLVGGVFH